MSNQRTEIKVGLFVVIGLVALVALVINFTKGVTAFRPTYTLTLETANVGGLKRNAPVLLAGVEVGKVQGYDLSPDNKSVRVALRIFSNYSIHTDAKFTIEASGFIGDQFVSIAPMKNLGPFLKDGDVVRAETPFNMQDAARTVLVTIGKVDRAVETLQGAVARVDRTVLSDESLTNASAAVVNFRRLSDQIRTLADDATTLVKKADAAVGRVDLLLVTNAAPASGAVSNLLMFSTQLNKVATELEALLTTNRMDVADAIRNFRTATAQVTNLMADLNAGKGVAGVLLKDERGAADLQRFLATLPALGSNANTVLTNLSVLATNAGTVFVSANQMFDRSGRVVDDAGVLISNLNRYGLFYGFLVKPKAAKTNAPARAAPLFIPREKSSLD
ncbi:MAG: MCE family protein [Verrucomicrobia bacterium]|nr:MCE family protein [Verrucomicrobiota bacterium]